MCRVAVFNKVKILGNWLDLLTLSNGGDGEGFISPQPLKEFRVTKSGQILDESVGEYHIKRWYIADNFENYVAMGYPRSYARNWRYNSTEYQHKDITTPWLLFHTRIRSAGGLGIKNTHPAVARDKKGFVLLMQNGHEPDAIQRIAMYKGYPELFDGTDYKSFAELLLLTKDFELFWLTSNSNWIVINGQTLYVYSGKERDPLYYYEMDGGFYIASEPLENDHYGGVFFNGLMKFKVTKEGLVYISEKTNNIRVREKPKYFKPTEVDIDTPPNGWQIEKEGE